MSMMTAIVVIVGIIVFGMVVNNRQGGMNNHGMGRDDRPDRPTPRELEMETELKQLRERVQVLERIATEDRDTKRLTAEIERLRDEEEDRTP